MPPRPGSRNAAPTGRSSLLVRAVAVLVVVAAALLVASYLKLPTKADLATLAKTTPPESALMRRRVRAAQDEGRSFKVRHAFVPLARISPMLQRAVVLAEDQKFWMHDGIDWGETRAAVQAAFDEGRLGRGGSTITQQLVKNLYLSERRSLVRKMWEWLLADRIEEALEKKRILELYLNFAEWGDGIFGAEAAAQAHFHKHASELDAAEAAVLTAMLPAPLKRDPSHPTPNLRRRAYLVASLMDRVGLAKEASTRPRLEAMLGKRDVSRKPASK